mmetsp:Transcript_27509/g.50082  ORF Transcript_27509/g.50082 Transcript_27509/m.50082 type:complete len:80 (+) Transcript_27509:62-301(+)
MIYEHRTLQRKQWSHNFPTCFDFPTRLIADTSSMFRREFSLATALTSSLLIGRAITLGEGSDLASWNNPPLGIERCEQY